MIRNAEHARRVIEHAEICAAPDGVDHCELCGKIAQTRITDADGYWVCGACEEEREAWERCEGCAVLVPLTQMRRVEGELATDELCEACVDAEHEASERAESDGYYDGSDFRR